MTNYQIGELLLVEFPFTASGPGKSRPALVILDTGDADVILARVTTQAHGSPFDVPIAAWQQAGLLAPSTVRLHKLATLAKNRVHKCLGKLEATDRRSLGHAKECGCSVPEILQNPTAVFQGLRSDAEEDPHGVGWRCYCGIPTNSYRADGTAGRPYAERVYLVFVNDESIAYNWRWEKADPDDGTLPVGYAERFKERLRWQ
jgi:mRNA interferase MazF